MSAIDKLAELYEAIHDEESHEVFDATLHNAWPQIEAVLRAYQRAVVADAFGNLHYVTANGIPQDIPGRIVRPLADALAALEEAVR